MLASNFMVKRSVLLLVTFMAGSDGEGFTIAMTRAEEAPGVDIVDPIERRRCTLRTSETVRPVEGDSSKFRFPIETTVDIETTDLWAPFTGHAQIRDHDGELITETANGSSESFDAQQYSIELTGLIKVYIRFHGEFSVNNGWDGLQIEFPQRTTVSIGSRSLHRHPATTIKTTSDPVDLIEAISTFGSALKTVTPERSFPTWRGHPPALEVGDELVIPDELSPPEQDLVIEVPATFEHLFPVAPLAYYLGAHVEVGHVPRIVGDELDYLLTHPQGFERGVHELLQRVFTLECITRTEGIYPVELLERNQLSQRVDLPLAELYNAPTSERLKAYLDIPFCVIEDFIPDWRLAAHVDATPESIPLLPHLSHDLALITNANADHVSSQTTSGTAGVLTRGSSVSERGVSSKQSTFIKPAKSPDALETAWISDGVPVNATKAVLDAYQNRIGRQPQEDSIEISVVCNSPEMEEELRIVDDVYGTRAEMPFDISIYEELSTADLEELIQQDFNFLHYIGHIDGAGFRCPDGRLDMTEIENVGPEAFFLNACQSYKQGLSLIEGGAIGGIVTLNDVINHGAVRVGQTVARLLNSGFPLRGALDIAATQSVVGRQYVVVGDGTLSIVQPPSGTPHLYDIAKQDSSYSLVVDGFGAPPGMGCLYLPYVDNHQTYQLAGGKSEALALDQAEAQELFNLENIPVKTDDKIEWSFDFFSDD